MPKVAKRRLDEELVAQGFFDTPDEASRSVMAGLVSSRGERLVKPGTLVKAGVELHVKGSVKASAHGMGVYVGRGGLKLEGALRSFGIDVSGLNCVDAGCSTGGFTDCLLRHGAARVAAVDVGYGQFDWRLRGDSRVALFERTNICDANPEELGYPFDLAVADVSFTSVQTILPSVMALLGHEGAFCTLVKPQFEAPRELVGEGGVVRNPDVHLVVLEHAVSALREAGLGVQGVCVSPVHGAKGNIEYFLHASKTAGCSPLDIPGVVRSAWV